jgi:hypothetical protein
MTDADSAIFSDAARGLLTSGASGAALIRRAADEGWAEELSGPAIEGLFDTQAQLLTERSPLLDLVALDALARATGQSVLDPSDTAVVYPAGLAEPGCRGSGFAFAGVDRARTLIVPIQTALGCSMATYPADLPRTQTTGIDPGLGLSRVDLDAEPLEVAESGLGQVACDAVVAAARVAVACELVGLARAMLALATTHVSVREQFGRPIGSFQAVRHQLADAFVAIDSAGLAVAQYWEWPDPEQAALTKSLAGWAHATTADVCLQVHGAIGFTAEHDLHRYIRRGWALDAILGSARELDLSWGARIVAQPELPRLGDLATPYSAEPSAPTLEERSRT